MATFKCVLSDYIKSNGQQAIEIRVTVNRKTKSYSTGYYAPRSDWNVPKEKLKSTAPNSEAINLVLIQTVNDMIAAQAELEKERSTVTPKAIIERAFATNSFYDIAQAYADKKRKKNPGTAMRYDSVINKLRKFRPELEVKDINSDFIEKYRDHLQSTGGRYGHGNAHNTVVSNLAAIRAIVNSSTLFKHHNPFKEHESKVGSFKKGMKGKKGKLTIEEIQKLEAYQPTYKWDKITKDLFLFCFFEAGMRIGDAFELKWEMIADNRINYDPGKVADSSGIDLSIPLHEKAALILEDYERKTDTVFNLFHESDPIKRMSEYKRTLAIINVQLKKIMLSLEIAKDISSHSARHSFAEIAKSASGRDVYSIQQSMGHTKIATTEIYLGADQSSVDELLEKVYW